MPTWGSARLSRQRAIVQSRLRSATHIVSRVGQIARRFRVALDSVEPAAQAQTCYRACQVQREGNLVVRRRRGRKRSRSEWEMCRKEVERDETREEQRPNGMGMNIDRLIM